MHASIEERSYFIFSSKQLLAFYVLNLYQQEKYLLCHWETFSQNSELLSSEAAKVFMTRLRRVTIKLQISPPSVILNEIKELFSTTNIEQLCLSEVMTDAAMRSINFMWYILGKKIYSDAVDWNFQDMFTRMYTFFQSSCISINQPDHLRGRVDQFNDYKIYVRSREEHSMMLLNNIQRILKRTPIMEANPGTPPSPLWQKLLAMEAIDDLAKGKEGESCTICQEEEVTQRNFCLLDNCDHHFCVECITQWFRDR